jgi:MerR family transcriptional regulator, redox-sensitive transcriptional activator SoxR
MKPLSIGQVAKRTGMRTSALRYYEKEGILPAAARIGGRRCYDPAVIRQIDILRFAQQAGCTLEEIKTLLRGLATDTPFSARWQHLAHAKLRELEAQAERIQRMRSALELSLKCGCVRVEECALLPASISLPNNSCRGSQCS